MMMIKGPSLEMKNLKCRTVLSTLYRSMVTLFWGVETFLAKGHNHSRWLVGGPQV